MKAHTRPTAPPPLHDDATRQAWYADLRDAQGKIRNRWLAPSITGALSTMTGGECVWCGAAIAKGLQVDHYLPSARFPRLSYHWDNLLPACGPCNQRKQHYIPPTLPPDTLTDPVFATTAPPYIPQQELPNHPRRLIEPTHEQPDRHLRFVPVAHTYSHLTPAGETTRRRFWADKADAIELEKISKVVAITVTTSISQTDLEDRLRLLVNLIGRSYYVDAYKGHWLAVTPPSWTRSQP